MRNATHAAPLWGRRRALFGLSLGLTFFLVGTFPAAADELRMAKQIRLKPRGLAQLGSGDAYGTLTTSVDGDQVRMVLSNLKEGGTSETQQLRTTVKKSDLSLVSSTLIDVVSGKKLRSMERKIGESVFGDKRVEVFEFKEFKDNGVTTTEPSVEFKVVDFISAILVAANMVAKGGASPVAYSMLRDRSVTKVIMTAEGEEQVGGRPGRIVRVAPPDNPKGGLVYVIARTDDGRYYPALLRAATEKGLIELEGIPGND